MERISARLVDDKRAPKRHSGLTESLLPAGISLTQLLQQVFFGLLIE
jgi:hypothetical protein